jgi:hypothetical protein
MFRKKNILYILWFFLVGNALFYAYGHNIQDSYREYSKLFEFRRLHPDFQPNTDIARFTVAGHTTTYADTIWIWLIQYIGDNVINGKYKDFSNPLIRNIVKIHPYFPTPYNLSLILSPNINRDKPGYEKNIPIGEDSLEIWEKGITLLCDQEKIKKIEKIDFSTELWENPTIENPCIDGMIAYNTAYVAQELLENKKAAYYYKIAAANKNWPQASRFLGPLMEAREWDHLAVAEKFLLMWIEWYDEDPYLCRSISLWILKDLKEKSLADTIKTLKEKESLIPEPQDTKNPLSSSASSCKSSVIRSMKQLYLAYITEITKGKPLLKDGKDILREWLIKTIPTVRDQEWWDVIRWEDGIWKYTSFPRKK